MAVHFASLQARAVVGFNLRRKETLSMRNRLTQIEILLAAAGLVAAAIALRPMPLRLIAAQPAKEAQASAGRGLNLADMDSTCKPCDDFYHYADGGWMKRNPIPPAYPDWVTFTALRERNREELHKILEAAAAKQAPEGSADQKIGDFYASCMNEPEVNAQGAKPLEPEMKRIEAIHDFASLQSEVARLQAEGVNALFNFGSIQDKKNSSQVIGGAVQGGLGLPDRDYYTKTDAHSKELRQQYVAHVAKMFQLLGDPAAKSQAEAKTVIDIETNLAQASMTRTERRDPQKTYHKMDRASLKALTPNFVWTQYFSEVGFPRISTVDVAEPEFFRALNGDLKSFSLDDWKIYLRWHLVHAAAPALSKPFVDANFDFYGRDLTGTKEILPRWKRCVSAADHQLGFALGKIYVEEYFPPSAKASADAMVHNLMATLAEDIKTLPWMGPETKKAALAKLNAFMLKIGYPAKWRSYADYHVDRGPYVLNVLRGNRFGFQRDLKKIGKPVDRTEWEMTPPTVNAYYEPSLNEIVFPAGILQPPFFDPKADDAVNYGGMGAVIGHEMTHGFDDEGRQYDAKGNLKNWWTPQDLKNFNARAKCIENQFDHYTVLGDQHENGKLVLGESIADLGGLTIAYKAFKKTPEGRANAPKIDGFTPDQRFFLAYARVWAGSIRPKTERMLLTVDPHPLIQFRAVAAPSNMSQFAKAFDCQKGDPMVRSTPCLIW
jgi:putative endopeptidase